MVLDRGSDWFTGIKAKSLKWKNWQSKYELQLVKLETLAALQTAMNLFKPFNLNTLIKFMKMSMKIFYF